MVALKIALKVTKFIAIVALKREDVVTDMGGCTADAPPPWLLVEDINKEWICTNLHQHNLEVKFVADTFINVSSHSQLMPV